MKHFFFSLIFSISISILTSEIALAEKETISQLSREVFKLAKEKNTGKLVEYFVDDLKKDENFLKKLETLLAKLSRNLDLKKIKEYDTIIFENKKSKQGEVSVDSNSVPRFSVEWVADPGKHALTLYSEKVGSNKSLWGLLFQNISGKWKLKHFSVGMLEFGGRNIFQWLNQVEDYQKRKWTIPSLLILSSAGLKLLTPLPFIRWHEAPARASSLKKELLNGLKIKFPVEVSTIQSKPTVYRIEPVAIEAPPYIYANVIYVTKFPLSKKSKIEKEAKAIQGKVESLFPGLTKMAPSLVFSIYEIPPVDPKKEYKNIRLVLKN